MVTENPLIGSYFEIDVFLAEITKVKSQMTN